MDGFRVIVTSSAMDMRSEMAIPMARAGYNYGTRAHDLALDQVQALYQLLGFDDFSS